MARLVGVVLADRYHLERLLNEGATGEVYRARHVGTDATLAVKVLHTEQVGDPVAVERFLREARITARIRHPNVVRLFDVGRAGAHVYMAMELLEGHDLRTELEGAMPWPFVRRVGLELCAGLAAAHAADVIHRDVKPENLFLAREDDRVRLKILDFGIARCEHDKARRGANSARAFGTPSYMSPEQARGLETDARADIYSAGCVLFELVTGRPPFDHPDGIETLRQVVDAPAPPLWAARRDDLPPALDACLARALAKEPRRRFARIDELAAALEAMPETMTDDSGPIRIRSPYRALVGVGATIMLALAVAVVWGSWGVSERRPEALPRAMAPAALPLASPPPPASIRPAPETKRVSGKATRPPRGKRSRRPVPVPELKHPRD